MVSFNEIPSTLRVPFVAAEFDGSRASQGPALLPYKALLIGQKLNSGSASDNSLHRVTNADAVVALAGRGSQLHRMALAWFSINKFTECWIGVLANSSGAYASGTITMEGPATADGNVSLYIGGELFSVAVSSGDSATTIATAIALAVGKHATGTVTFSAADAADNITVGATTFVGTTGAVTLGAATYSIDTGNTEAAASFAAQVNGHAVASKVVKAVASSAVVTLTAIAGGTDGNSIVLTSTDGTDTAVSGSGTLSGAGADSDAAVHATSSGAVVTLNARNNGLHANEIDVRVNYQDGEELPAGTTATIVAMSGGTTNPTLTSLIAAMGDIWYQVIAHPYSDATSLSALETELSDRFGPLRMIDGSMFTAKSGSLATISTLGGTRNSKHSTIVEAHSQPRPPNEVAAAVAATVAYYGNIDPARPFQTLSLPWLMAPAETERFTLSERNQLLYDGISTTRTSPGGEVQIDRLITTYQTNAAGSPDTAYLDVNTLLTLMYLRYSVRAWFATRYPRHKLMSDGTRVAAGQAVMTPKIAKADCVAWFESMVDLGLVEGVEQFKQDLVVERNVSDPNRLDFLISPDLVNQLIVSAIKIQFLL